MPPKFCVALESAVKLEWMKQLRRTHGDFLFHYCFPWMRKKKNENIQRRLPFIDPKLKIIFLITLRLFLCAKRIALKTVVSFLRVYFIGRTPLNTKPIITALFSCYRQVSVLLFNKTKNQPHEKNEKKTIYFRHNYSEQFARSSSDGIEEKKNVHRNFLIFVSVRIFLFCLCATSKTDDAWEK